MEFIVEDIEIRILYNGYRYSVSDLEELLEEKENQIDGLNGEVMDLQEQLDVKESMIQELLANLPPVA